MAWVTAGAGPQQTLSAFREAEAYDRPSLLIAYSHCIGQGSEIRSGLDQQYKAVASGQLQQTVRQRWPIYEEMATRSAGDFPAAARKDH
jgi:pyruvate/2-oxoacid:ferredoxin oxidoreductase beta subunit